MLSKRELKATKIHAPEYKPTGGCFPRAGNSTAEVLENVHYVDSEIKRWYESIAWATDSASFRSSVVGRLPAPREHETLLFTRENSQAASVWGDGCATEHFILT